jgi:hypothetical protein
VFAAIAVSVQALRITGKPTEYVALGKVVAGQKSGVDRFLIHISSAEFYGTEMEIIMSGELRRRALERVRSLHPELKEINVRVRVFQTKGSSILNVMATGEEAKYTRIYLDALLDEYIAFGNELIDRSIGASTQRIINEKLSYERQSKEAEKALEAFQKQNDLVIFSEEHERLVKKASRLRSELEDLKSSNPEAAQTSPLATQLVETENRGAEIWNKICQHKTLQQNYKDAENAKHEWSQLLEPLKLCDDHYPMNIMERPTAAVPDKADLWLSLGFAALTGAAAGVLFMFIAAFALTRLSKNPGVSPPPLN